MLVLVGGGKMGEALLRGWQSAGVARDVVVVELADARRKVLAELLPDIRVVGDLSVIGLASVLGGSMPAEFDVVLAVKPADVAATAARVGEMGARRVLSIAAGVTLETLAAACPSAEVIRVMPNTPALVGHGMSAIALGSTCSDDTREWAVGLLGAVGEVVVVAESALDAVTAVSGSGPAYLFLVAEALVDAAVLMGLPRDLSNVLVSQTIRGAGEMLVQAPGAAAQLRGDVTSPGGTTAAGLRELEVAGVRAGFLEAVKAAATRSRELGHRA